VKQARIAQIIPAHGWYATYTDDEPGTPLDPVVCFALVEFTDGSDSWQEVKPMVGDRRSADFLDGVSNFAGMVFKPGPREAVA